MLRPKQPQLCQQPFLSVFSRARPCRRLHPAGQPRAFGTRSRLRRMLRPKQPQLCQQLFLSVFSRARPCRRLHPAGQPRAFGTRSRLRRMLRPKQPQLCQQPWGCFFLSARLIANEHYIPKQGKREDESWRAGFGLLKGGQLGVPGQLCLVGVAGAALF